MAELIIQSGKYRGKKLILPETEVTVGRDEDCQVRLATDDVSRKHCTLRSTPEGLVVRDLGSRNGTLVNDVRIESERLLVPGDTIRIGPILLEVPGSKPAKTATAQHEAPSASSIHAVTADEIAGWLTESDEGAGSGTTTIIRATLSATSEGESSGEIDIPSDYAIPTTASNVKKKKFKSIAEEAAHVISCWKELVAQEEE